MSNKNSAGFIVVVGAGQIGTPVVERLAREGRDVVWVSRTVPAQVPAGARHVSLDVAKGEELGKLARGAHAIIAAVNPAIYDAKVWARTLPPMHRGLVEGARAANVRLVLLDALYLYSLDQGPLSPSTPQVPSTEKGKIRKQLADRMAAAQKSGLRAAVLRAPDFWGPDLSSALLNREALAGLKQGKRPLLVGNPDVPHAFSHRDDVVDALIRLADAPNDVEGCVFHAPVIHETPRAMVDAYAKAYGVQTAPRVAPRWMLRLVGLFSPAVGGMIEMLPQWEAPYLVDDRLYRERFAREATTLSHGVAQG